MRSLPSSLTAKVKQSLQTIGNNSQPKFKIAISRAKTTVSDANYWTVETIRTKAGLGDVSVAPRRYLRANGGPDRLYEIHVDNGQVHTAIREFPDKLKQGWQTQFELGAGSAVSIAFNGYWKRHKKLWRLITEDKPWISWVDGAGVLWSQRWDDETTKIQIDIDVSKVKMIRAWKNVNIPENDQGVVVGYIKTDGTVWYRSYCQQANYSYIWEHARHITQFEEPANTLNLFITNDYRMGFTIQSTNDQMYWLITPRNWSGMALEKDVITVSAKATIDLQPVTYHNMFTDDYINVSATASATMLFGSTENSVVRVENIEVEGDWGRYIEVDIKHPWYTLPHVVLTDMTNMTTIPIDYITLDGLIRVSNDLEFGINAVVGDIRIVFTNGQNEAGIPYDPFEVTFTPQNLVPPMIPIPEVLEVWNE